MESKIIITKEIIDKATAYVPLQLKAEIAESIAQSCTANVAMSRVGKNGERNPLPYRCQERQIATNLYMMGILAREYLHIPYDGEDDSVEDNPYYGLMMPANTYDLFAGSHILNQLEKLKGDKDCRDKVFAILYDYRQFQRMVLDEIRCIVEHRNDVVYRLLEALEVDVQAAVASGINGAGVDSSETAGDAGTLEEAEKLLARYRENKAKFDAVGDALEKKLESLRNLSAQEGERTADE